jgi:hypothetical protein
MPTYREFGTAYGPREIVEKHNRRSLSLHLSERFGTLRGGKLAYHKPNYDTPICHLNENA